QDVQEKCQYHQRLVNNAISHQAAGNDRNAEPYQSSASAVAQPLFRKAELGGPVGEDRPANCEPDPRGDQGEKTGEEQLAVVIHGMAIAAQVVKKGFPPPCTGCGPSSLP